MNCLATRYDPLLLASAVLILTAGSFGVFRIRSRMVGSHDGVRKVWLALCGIEAGAAIWGTHLISMLAMQPAARLGYDPLGVLGSLLVAVVGSTAALALAWSSEDRTVRATGGGLLAVTVGALHYMGMSAQVVEARVAYEPILVWLSLAVGAALACGALLVAGSARRLAGQVAGAALFSGAIASIHFIGMAATTMTPDPRLRLPEGVLDGPATLMLGSIVSVLMVIGGWGAAYIDFVSSRQATRRMQRLADATREGLAVLGDDRRIVDCNAAFAAICGRPVSELRRESLFDLVKLDDEAGLQLDSPMEGEVAAADGRRTPVRATLRFVAAQGEDGRPRLIITLADLTEQRAAEARIRYLNEHDALTGLPNREVLTRTLRAAYDSVRSTDANSLVLCCVRVTNSQEVNTLHGHAAGDALLAKVGERLGRFVAPGACAARLGGNEFALIVFGVRDETAGAAGDVFFPQLLQSLTRPLVWDAHPVEPQIRIGVASFPHDAADPVELMMHAESALQACEEDAAHGFAYFRREKHEARNAQRALAQDLRVAIAEDQLTVFYQPQARSEDGVLCGFEALVRWTHPRLGFLPPDRFISVAEESGLIGDLGDWVLRRACLDAATWPKPVPVAVNLSPIQVAQPDLPTRVHEILLESGLSPGRLELEITESALFRDFQRALDTLRRLKALGVRIAMDDFGTGFSSLSTLQSFPFDKIKIDKSFVEGVGKLERSTVIVKAVLGIGRGLAIPVVAEGVETAEQMSFLRDELCAVVQGYHIGKPGPVALHEALFSSAPETPARRPRKSRAA